MGLFSQMKLTDSIEIETKIALHNRHVSEEGENLKKILENGKKNINHG